MSAIYLQIQKDLLQKIKTGVYPVGDTIPAETILAKEYQVSRPTVRQAISLLVEQGILERKRKRGTIVCPPKIDQSFTQRINSFDSEMHQKGHTSQTQVLAFYKEPASDEVKRVLRCEYVFKLVRLRSIDDTPNVFVTTYMPYELFSHFETIDFARDSFYEQCKRSGHPITSITRHLEVAAADETLADLLQVQVGSHLFYFHSYGYDDKGIPIEYSISKYRGDTNSFTFHLAQ